MALQQEKGYESGDITSIGGLGNQSVALCIWKFGDRSYHYKIKGKLGCF